jgi:hypothetical protein
MVSTLARSQSSRPCSPRRSKTTRWSASKTPALAHSVSRRQQVAGASRSPASRSPVRGRAAAARGWRSGHEHDRSQAGPIRDGAASATVERARRGREQGRHQRPELVRDKLISKGCHGAGSCQTNPKGAKRRLNSGRWRPDYSPMPSLSSVVPRPM